MFSLLQARRKAGVRRERPLSLEVLEGRLCLTTNSYLYITSFGTNTVERYEELSGAPAPADGQTGATFVEHNSGGVNHPLGVIIGPRDHNLYVTSLETNEVLRYDGQTGAFLGAFVTADDGLVNPAGIAFGPDGLLYVANADPATSNIMRFDPQTGAYIDTFVQLDTMGGATSMVFGPDGRLYISTRFSNGVIRCDNAGFCEQFIQEGDGGLNRTGGFVFGPDGDFYVASETTNNVLHFDGVSGQLVGEFVAAGSGGLNRPAGIIFGPYGDLYVASASSNSILHYNGDTGAFINAFATQHDDQVLSGPREVFFGNSNPTTFNYVPRREPGTGPGAGSGGSRIGEVGTALTANAAVRGVVHLGDSGPGVTVANVAAVSQQSEAGTAESVLVPVGLGLRALPRLGDSWLLNEAALNLVVLNLLG